MGLKYITLAMGVALALAACGPKAGESASGGGPAAGGGSIFPSGGGASYKAVYEMKLGNAPNAPGNMPPQMASGAMEMTMYRSGGNMRNENGMMQAITGNTMVTISNTEKKEAYTFPVGPKAQKMATKISYESASPNFMPKMDPAFKPTKLGSDTVAGLSCNIWQMPDRKPGAGDSAAPATPGVPDAMREMCLTDDGIMLRVGSADKPLLIAKTVEKGPQDPALFQLPAGYEVNDLGDCPKIMREAYSGGADGVKPDAAKVAECRQKLMKSFGGMMGAP